MLVDPVTFTRRRFTFTAGAIDPATGRPAAATSVDTPNLRANIDPVPGEDIAKLPEGQRSSDQIYIITQADLRGGDETSQEPPDHVLYDGKIYEVQAVKPFPSVLVHIEVRAKRIQGG